MTTRSEATILRSIVGWHCSSHIAKEHAKQIADYLTRGLITTRPHVYIDGSKSWAYCLTETGFQRLRELTWPELEAEARQVHRWYAAQRSKWISRCFRGHGDFMDGY